ncbi:MAG: YdcH family protein [Acidobacteriota bacterium]|nr:YdcH family protein [Acidobacteriota bacterium]MDQ2979880.1 YdcH family protein [Acidobacteriota bacterium]
MQNQTESLSEVDAEYRRLHDAHQDHEHRLQTLAGKSQLSQDEEIEEKRLKKEKLALKDRMEAIARNHREGVPH